MNQKIASFLLLFYVLALHTSMAGMELFGWLIFAFGLGSLALKPKTVRFKMPLGGPALIYLGLVLLSILTTHSESPWIKRFADTTWILTLWGVTMSLYAAWSPSFERKMLKLWGLALLCATGVGLYQFFVGYDFIRGTSANLPQIGHFFRATGFFSLCLTFAYSMGLSGFSLSLPSHRLHKFGPYLIVFLGGVCTFVSMTRGAWLAYLGTLVILTLLFIRKLTARQILAVFSFLLVYSLVLTYSEGGAKRLEKISVSSSEAQISDGAVSERFAIWKGYFEMFKKHPLLGVGYNEGVNRLTEAYRHTEKAHLFSTHAHNDYLQILTETGALGLLAFLFLIGSAFYKAFQLRKTRWDWSLALMAGQLYIYIGCLTQGNFTDAEVNHFLIFNWALVNVLTMKIKDDRSS